MSQLFYLRHVPLAFGWFGCQSVFPEESHHLPGMYHVGPPILREYENINQVWCTKLISRRQHCVHYTLKYGWRVLQPEWHPREFEFAERTDEGSVLTGTLSHLDLAFSQVKFRQHTTWANLLQNSSRVGI